jgi:CMP-N-acetylneuraminic acid synthetase
METLGVIPARGGSKGIPRKNLALLAGKPLLAYTCEQALGAKRLSRVIVSTDDERVAQCARDYQVDVPFLRPPELATDEAPMLGVLQHALGALQHAEGYVPDAIVLLQPSSPLRRSHHIDEAIQLLHESGADSVVSVVEVPHQFHPGSVLRIEKDSLVPYLPGAAVLRRQEKPSVYARNGPAIVATRRQVLEHGSLFGETVRPFLMSREESVDIDEPVDLIIAEALMAHMNFASRNLSTGQC